MMPRTDLYLKVVVDHDEHDTPEKMARELCRTLEKIYGVRTAELSSHVTRTAED